MSVIARQSIKYTLLSYLSFGIGTLSAIFLYPNNSHFYGITQFVLANAELIMPFLVFGFTSSMVKFFPDLQEKKLEHASLFYALGIVVITSCAVAVVGYILMLFFPAILGNELVKWLPYSMILAVFLSIIQIFTRFASNYQRIVVPTLFHNLMLKIASIVAFVLCIYGLYSEQISLFVFVAIIGFSAVFLMLYTYKITKLQLHNPLKIHKNSLLQKQMLTFAIFAILGGIGNTIALRIDKWMIGRFFEMKDVGNYSILAAIVTLLSIPTLGLYSIVSPMISDYFKTNQLDKISNLYQKSTSYLFLLASFLFCLIIAGMDGLFAMMKNSQELLSMKNVLIVLGISTLIDVATGFNNQILAYSKFYKYNMYTVLGLALLTLCSNYIFIQFTDLRLLGVAIATLLSMSIFNAIKCIFIYQKFRMQPFGISYIYLIALILFVLVSMRFLPKISVPILDILYKCSLVVLLFFVVNSIGNFIDLKQLLSKNWKSYLTGKIN